MAKLTEEQFRVAHRLMLDNGYSVSRTLMEKLAPYLQLPWDEPTKDESILFRREIEAGCGSCVCGYAIEHALHMFVRRRNKVPQPKPVDPRREKIEAEIRIFLVDQSPGVVIFLTDRILAALNEMESCLCIVGCSVNGRCPIHGYVK